MTFAEAVQAARRRLADAGIDPEEAARDAELLARHAARWDRATYLARAREAADDRWRHEFSRLIERRARREPVAYIRGVQEFWGRSFLVSPAVLIPRPETELLIEEALAWMGTRSDRASLGIADIGTGSGCLAVTLAAELPDIRVLATDVSEEALAVAAANATRHDVRHRITLLNGAYLDPIAGALDLVIANPPYVAAHDRSLLAPEVADFEPPTALFGGDDGLRDLRVLVTQAAERLAPGGALMMEIGAGQEAAVTRMVQDAGGLSLERVRHDLQGIARTVTIARG